MAHAFISYVRDDQQLVNKLCEELRARNVEVWLDRDSIDPGQRWQPAIQNGINGGAFFLACFSKAYATRSGTYMHEELQWATEFLRRNKERREWFIPIKFSECEIPALDIGNGETVRDIQWVDLNQNWSSGIVNLLRVVRPTSYLNPVFERQFRDFFQRHIESKIAVFRSQGGLRVEDLEQRWRMLMEPVTWNRVAGILYALMNRSNSLSIPLTDRYSDSKPDGCDILITVSPTTDPNVVLRSLGEFKVQTNQMFFEFLKEQRERMRMHVHWDKKDLAHWFLMTDNSTNEWVVDLMYLPSLELQMVLLGHQLEREKHGVYVPSWGTIYPTSLIGAAEFARIVGDLMMEGTHILQPEQFKRGAKSRSWWQFWRR